MFDEQPDGDPHGECAAEINRLELALAAANEAAIAVFTGIIERQRAWADKHALVSFTEAREYRETLDRCDWAIARLSEAQARAAAEIGLAAIKGERKTP